MNEGIEMKEMVIELLPNLKAIRVHVATRRAAIAALAVAKKYQANSENSLNALDEMANGNRRLHSAETVFISHCFDLQDVYKVFDEASNNIRDGFSSPPAAPKLSEQMVGELINKYESAEDALNAACLHGYTLGRSDAGHEVQDDVMWAPYVTHTPQEMIWLLESIYIEAEGDQLDFVMRIKRSADARLRGINTFTCEVLFALIDHYAKK